MAGPGRTSPSKAAKPQSKAAAPARTPAGGSKAGIVKGGSPAARLAASSAADAVARLKSVGSSNVARYLADKGAPALIKGVGVLQKLRRNEQSHDNAGQKLNQSEKAVEIPKSEEQSKGNAGQVDMVDARPKPVADDAKAKGELQNTLTANIPRTIEDVDNFKSDQKAQVMGADVMTVVQGDKAAVTSTFQDMERTPPPIPSDHKTEALPPQEAAPPTAVMNLGQAAVAPLQKEHTDVSNFTKEADGKLQEEGVTQEQLDMVDSGDLAAANKEKKGMEKMAVAEPLAIQNFARQESERVDKDLKQQEKSEREGMRAKRRAALGATAAKQKGTKTALEKKRDEVAGRINGIYKAAQDKVKEKLAKLETQSMKRFDDGNTNASKAFEENVNREFAAYKADRYSGLGRLKKVRDWLLGMDDLPGVKAIFERNRAIFVKTINKLVEEITADNKRVIQECKDDLAKARKDIKEFVDKLEPGLKDIGKKSAEEMDAKLDDLDRLVAKKEQELQDKLKDKQQAAIKAIDEKIEKMKEAMSGALAKLGKLLLLAAKKFFSWALEKAGFSLSDIESIINKGIAVLKAIFTKPIQFVKNLIKAASTGFQNFGKNFLKHLKDAVFEWLTGSLEGVTLPENWDLKGILSLVFQLVGLTYQNIRSHLVKLIPEPVVKTLETGFTLVKTLITEGPMAAWEQLKEMAGEMKEAFIEAVKDWIKWKVVEEAIKTVLAIFVPGAGIIKAIIAIYDTIVFFIQKAKEILKMVGNFLGSIADIAAGNIGGAATALEDGLARALKLVIDFLARFLHLTGITNAIKKTIQKIRGKVDDVIIKVAKWIVSKAKNLIGKLAGKDKGKELTGKDKDKETPESKDVKAKVNNELNGKEVTDKKQEQALITSIYNKYRPIGLKSIKFVKKPDADIDVIVSASLAEKVASLKYKDLKKLLTIARNMNPYSKKTTIYVSYDDGTHFGIIKDKKSEGHAETRFKNKMLPDLLNSIEKNRKKLKTPMGEPVPVTLDINRTPCDGCSKENLIKIVESVAASENPDRKIKLIVNAVAIYKAEWRGPELTAVESVIAMKDKGIEITVSTVWEAIEAKLKQFQQFEWNGKMYADWEIRRFLMEAPDLQRLLDDAVKKINDRPPKEEKKGD